MIAVLDQAGLAWMCATTSILKLITRRFDLEPLPGVRRDMGDLTAAFDL